MKSIILLACIALAFAAPPAAKKDADEKPVAEILRSYNEQEEDGGYKFGFESSDDIAREETGKVLNAGEEDQTMEVVSKYRYLDPNGNPVEGEQTIKDGQILGRYSYTDANDDKVEVHYTATKSGFVPYGTNIAKEISENAENAPPLEEEEGGARKVKATEPKKKN